MSNTISYMTVYGYKIRVAHWRGTNSNSPPLLFFNGIGTNLETAQPLTNYLDRDIITFDPPGIGKSPVSTFPYRPLQICKIARHIVTQLGYDKVDVMGLSWGGAMAQQYTFQYGCSVNKLILAATFNGYLSIPGLGPLKILPSLSRIENLFAKKTFTATYGDPYTPEIAAHVRRSSLPTLKGLLFQLLAVTGWTSVPFLPLIKQPTLVLMGENDQISPVINGKVLTSLIPDARLEVIPDSGHMFLLSRQAESMSLLSDFLAGKPVADQLESAAQ